jgi:hypothetical protein
MTEILARSTLVGPKRSKSVPSVTSSSSGCIAGTLQKAS